MGLTLQWAVRCNDKECIQRVYEGLKKIDDTFIVRKHGDNILACTGEKKESLCINLTFEPWEKALKQSYVMKKMKFKLLGFGDPVFDGEGPFGHNIPEKMMKLIDGREGRCEWMTNEGETNLGERGYQTGNFIKTQYRGIEEHLKTCRIMDTIRANADKAIIGDDGHYCGEGDKHDMATLMDSFEEYTKLMVKIGDNLRKSGWTDNQLGGEGEKTRQRVKGVQENDLKYVVDQAKKKFPPEKHGGCYVATRWIKEKIPEMKEHTFQIENMTHCIGILPDGRVVDTQLHQILFIRKLPLLEDLILHNRSIFTKEEYKKLFPESNL